MHACPHRDRVPIRTATIGQPEPRVRPKSSACGSRRLVSASRVTRAVWSMPDSAITGWGDPVNRTVKVILLAAVLTAAMVLGAAPARAGSPHFIRSSLQVSTSGATLAVSGTEAGLGDEPQVHLVLTAAAQCINGGGHHPQAGNKQAVTAAGDFPVQNGHARFSLTATAVFSPPCSPPMTVVFTDATLTDQTSGATIRLF